MAEQSMEIRDLPNLGPKSQEMLARGGIHSPQQLRELGAIAAYMKVRRSGANVSLNLLWAMEGALSGRDWRKVAHEDRLRLLLALQEAQNQT